VRPMELIFCSLSYPPFQKLLLRSGEGLLRFGWRHEFIRVGRKNVLNEFALVRPAWNDGFLLESDLAHIQPELGFPLVFVRPMAGITVLGENRADVTIELDLVCLRGVGGRDGEKQEK